MNIYVVFSGSAMRQGKKKELNKKYSLNRFFQNDCARSTESLKMYLHQSNYTFHSYIIYFVVFINAIYIIM